MPYCYPWLARGPTVTCPCTVLCGRPLNGEAAALGADCHGVITMHPLELLAFTYGCIWEPLNDVEPPPVDPVRVIIPVRRGGGFDEIAVLPVTYV